MTSLFSAAENAEGFKVNATTNRSANGERIFTTPDTGYWWHEMEAFINTQYCEGAVIAPLMFYSDQTCLSNNMRIHGYPLVMTIGNVSLENRREDTGHELLAILPTFQGSSKSFHFKLVKVFKFTYILQFKDVILLKLYCYAI